MAIQKFAKVKKESDYNWTRRRDKSNSLWRKKQRRMKEIRRA